MSAIRSSCIPWYMVTWMSPRVILRERFVQGKTPVPVAGISAKAFSSFNTSSIRCWFSCFSTSCRAAMRYALFVLLRGFFLMCVFSLRVVSIGFAGHFGEGTPEVAGGTVAKCKLVGFDQGAKVLPVGALFQLAFYLSCVSAIATEFAFRLCNVQRRIVQRGRCKKCNAAEDRWNRAQKQTWRSLLRLVGRFDRGGQVGVCRRLFNAGRAK